MGFRTIGGGGVPTPTLPSLVTGRYGLTAAPGASITTGTNGWGGDAQLGTLDTAIDELLIAMSGFTTSRQIVLDIRTGTTRLVQDFHLNCQQNVPYLVRFPIRIAAGTVLTARAAAVAGSSGQIQALGVVSSVAQTASSIKALSAYAGSGSPVNSGVPVLAGGGWTAIGSGLPAAAVGGIITLGINGQSTSRTATALSIEVSLDGGATTFATFTGYQFTTGLAIPPMLFWKAMAAGAQLHLRIVSSVAPSANDTFNVNIHPVY